MKRKLNPCQTSLTVERVETFAGGLRAWLTAQAKAHHLRWLLAHAEDGVIWGELRDGALITSDTAAKNDQTVSRFCPPLRVETLQTARLFAPTGELLLWRDGDQQWHCRVIRESADAPTLTEYFDEPHMLWGDYGRALEQGFVLMEDGKQGLRHVVPLPNAAGNHEKSRPLRLWTRHYVQDDDNGFARISAGRLTDLKMEVSV
jgi:CRISPR-associated protein (TIGR03984 family)